MFRLNLDSHKAMRIICRVDLEYFTIICCRINVFPQNTISTAYIENVPSNRGCDFIDWIIFQDAIGVIRYAVHTSINANYRSTVLITIMSQMISDTREIA